LLVGALLGALASGGVISGSTPLLACLWLVSAGLLDLAGGGGCNPFCAKRIVSAAVVG